MLRTIRARIFTALALLLMVLSAFIGSMLNGMGTVGTDFAIVNDEAMPAVKTAAALRYATARVRTAQARHLISADSAGKADAARRIDATMLEVAELRATMEVLGRSGEKQALLRTFDKAWAEYTKASNGDLLSLSVSNPTAAGARYTALLPTFEEAAGALGKLVVLAEEDARGAGRELDATIKALTIWMIGSAILVVAILAAISLGIDRLVTKPISLIAAYMGVLSRGNLAQPVPFRDRKDEVGTMAQAVDVFRDGLLAAERLRAERAADAQRSEAARKASLQAMADRVESESRRAVEAIAFQSSGMSADAGLMATSAGVVGQQSQTVAAAAEQTLANAQTVAAATEELAAAISEIAGQVAMATRTSRDAVEQGRISQRAIQSLAEAIGHIGAVAELIRGIAGQTNLLALNATIEAARAGEAGKGFAVVANEVKGLATQTARATEDIARQLADLQARTGEAVATLDSTWAMIEKIDSVSAAIAAAMEEQSAATQEIARNVAQTADAAHQVSSSIAAVSGEAQAVGSKAADVSGGAATMAESVRSLQEILVRVVRTSTDDVDRRKEAREDVRVPARAVTPAGIQAVTIVDLSANGAAVAGLPDGIERGRLQLPGETEAEFAVRSVRQDKVGIAFDAPIDPAVVRTGNKIRLA